MNAPTPGSRLAPEPLAEHLERLRRTRDPAPRVALANGCFDLLHPGHVRYFRAARDRADLLVVGLNADPTVRRLKGEGRPLLPARQRAALVAAVDAVDFVTVFHEPTADRLITLLRPDLHCKGTDYVDGVPEADTVRETGGEVALVGGPKAFDTRELIDRLRRL